jgi:hypothetical protein
MVRITGQRRPDRGTMADQAPTAIIGCPHMTTFRHGVNSIKVAQAVARDECRYGPGGKALDVDPYLGGFIGVTGAQAVLRRSANPNEIIAAIKAVTSGPVGQSRHADDRRNYDADFGLDRLDPGRGGRVV